MELLQGFVVNSAEAVDSTGGTSVIVLVHVSHLKRILTSTHEPVHAQNGETSGSVYFLQPCPMLAADNRNFSCFVLR
jgi:hypothetical protein